MTYYSGPLRKSAKWYRKLAFDLMLNISVVNAWIVYQEITYQTIPITEFRVKLVKEMLYSGDEGVAGPSCENIPKRATTHKLEKKEGIRCNYHIRRYCKLCYQDLSAKFGADHARNHTKKVVTFCANCPDQPSMCLDCFNNFHK